MMSDEPSPSQRQPEYELEQRVRYAECDPMGVAHHGVFPEWFETARTELLRRTGISYAELEERGVLLMVARLDITYRRPARYDEVVRILARLARVSAARIEHEYEVRRDGELLCTGSTTLACVNREGKVRPLPDVLGGRRR